MLRVIEYFPTSLKVIQNGTLGNLGYGYKFAFYSNYGSILYHFRDKTRYWPKIVIFHTPLHSTPSSGGHLHNIAMPFGVEKLEWYGYMPVKKV